MPPPMEPPEEEQEGEEEEEQEIAVLPAPVPPPTSPVLFLPRQPRLPHRAAIVLPQSSESTATGQMTILSEALSKLGVVTVPGAAVAAAGESRGDETKQVVVSNGRDPPEGKPPSEASSTTTTPSKQGIWNGRWVSFKLG